MPGAPVIDISIQYIDYTPVQLYNFNSGKPTQNQAGHIYVVILLAAKFTYGKF
jgi:hypothetical protein